MPVPTSIADVRRQSLREIAEFRIREAILDGTFEPGETLHDQELQDWLGVSRTPIRDALNDLSRVGLVETAPQRYTRVARPTPDAQPALSEATGALLCAVLRLTVVTIDGEARDAVLTTLDDAAAALDAADPVAYGRAVRRFVERIVDACPNEVLVDAVRDIAAGLAFRLTISLTVQASSLAVIAGAYPLLRAAVAAGDAEAAARAAAIVFTG